jgi:Holliday junction resolvase-like predicted endonuclease
MQTSERFAAARQVHEVAREYRSKGYEVIVEPEAAELPEPLARFRPDVVARKADEVVVVEVKSRGSLSDPELQQLAKVVRAQPGWRFELVILKLEPGPPGTRAWNAEDAADALRQVEAILRSGHRDAALLLAWSAAEATLRLLADKERLVLDRDDALYLLKLLATRAVITRDQHDLLWEVLQLRNAVAHGHKPPELDPAKIRNLCETVSALLEQASRRSARTRQEAMRDHA